MKILHVTPSYYPATYFGGPIFSTYALCNALVAIPGIELRVLTSDTAGPNLSDRVPVTSFPMRLNDGYDVYYTRRTHGADIAPGMLTHLPGMVCWADAILLTATYSFPTIPTLLACKLRGKPVVWSPRGALKASDDWKDARRKNAKRLWEWVCRSVSPQRCVLHVTTDIERKASLARMPGFEACVIANGVNVPSELRPRSPRPKDRFRLMALGRLHPVKALENLIDALALVGPEVTLDVYGTGDAAYLLLLHKRANALGLWPRVKFHGHVEGEAKAAAFLSADVLVLPSHSENFSMVVAEALAHGVPAIVSHGAPWPEIEVRGCGLWVDNAPSSLARAIKDMGARELSTMGERGRIWMQSEYGWESKAREMSQLFRKLLPEGGGP